MLERLAFLLERLVIRLERFKKKPEEQVNVLERPVF